MSGLHVVPPREGGGDDGGANGVDPVVNAAKGWLITLIDGTILRMPGMTPENRRALLRSMIAHFQARLGDDD